MARYCCLGKETTCGVCHADSHVPKSQTTEGHQNHQQVDQAANVFPTDLDWEHKGELFLAWWVHQDIREEMQHRDGLMTEGQI